MLPLTKRPREARRKPARTFLSTFSTSVVALGPDDAFAVGRNGATLRWDGTAWAEVSVSQWNDMGKLWVSPTGTIYALRLDSWSEGVLMRWEGSNWTAVQPAPPEQVGSYWGASESDFWTSGQADQSTRPRSIGTAPSGRVTRGTQTRTSSCDLGGENVFDVLRYDGSSWIPTGALGEGYPTVYPMDAWGSSPNDIWIAGSADGGNTPNRAATPPRPWNRSF
jgi:hypothetical protein